MREILKAGRHLLGLINEVLDLAKIESGHMTLSIETILLGPVIDECEQLLRPLATERGISCACRSTSWAPCRPTG